MNLIDAHWDAWKKRHQRSRTATSPKEIPLAVKLESFEEDRDEIFTSEHSSALSPPKLKKK